MTTEPVPRRDDTEPVTALVVPVLLFLVVWPVVLGVQLLIRDVDAGVGWLMVATGTIPVAFLASTRRVRRRGDVALAGWASVLGTLFVCLVLVVVSLNGFVR
jgi:hypothetical protein